MGNSMRKTIMATTAVAAVFGWAVSAAAADLPTWSIEDFRMGAAPAGVEGLERPAAAATEAKASTRERSSAINGTLYSVIAPTYNGAGGTTSFIRLFNGAPQSSIFSVTVVGSPSGRTYGSANISVPRSASRQFSLAEILTLAAAGALTGGDTVYALYVQNADQYTGWQHVTFNASNNFFENNSLCNTTLNQQIASTSTQVLVNVHTTRLAAFPSKFLIHNYWNAPVTYRVTAIDSVTGTVINAINMQTAANASYEVPVSQLQTQLNFTPAVGQNHINLFVTDPTGAPPYEVIGHSVFNQGLSADLNLTTVCAVNGTTSTTMSSEGPGLNGY